MKAVVWWGEPVEWCWGVTGEVSVPDIECGVQGGATAQVFGEEGAWCVGTEEVCFVDVFE